MAEVVVVVVVTVVVVVAAGSPPHSYHPALEDWAPRPVESRVSILFPLTHPQRRPMMSTEDRDHSSPVRPASEQDETEELRQQRKLDKAWDKSESTRREEEIQRRVKEQWRGPYA